MKTIFKILKWTVIAVFALIAGIFVFVQFTWAKKWDAPYPDIHASLDSVVINRGKHLALSTAHCVECHFKPEDSLKVITGEDVALAGGGFPFEFPGGVFYAPNISSDKETGIGRLTDGEIARALRYGVKHKGTMLIPAMEFQNLSDEDLTAIISYLRTLPPITYKVPENHFNIFGKAILAFILRPEKPKITPPVKVLADTTIEYGRYIGENISSCRSCHTERSQSTGEYIGEELAGGLVGPVPGEPTKILISPNLTPDPETGHLYNWSFVQFNNRFQQGKLVPQSIMPWGQFKHLDETELLALWKYLHSVKPVHRNNGVFIQDAK